jgi:hypothetical protein
MTERDSDIEFDFFEDLDFEDVDTREAAPTEEGQREGRFTRQGPPSRRPDRGPGGFTPLFRLAGLIAFVILVIVLLVFWVQSCGGSGKRGAFERYLDRVSAIGKDSQQIGQDLTEVLTTPGLKAIEIDPRIDGLAKRSQQVAASARAIDAPGSLREGHLELIESLQLRVRGLRGLAAAFRNSVGSKDVAQAGIRLASWAQRLVASDVVWDDLFKLPTTQQLTREGVTGLAVPDSNFASSADFGSPRYWVLILDRFSGTTGTGTTGGLHGTGLVSVVALPSEVTLVSDQENTVTAGTDLGFQVTVEDTGDAQEVQIKVTLTIQQRPSPIVATRTIEVINPGEQKSVVFRNLGQVQFATRTTVKVDVQPVPNEQNTGNNSASYPVIFSLG